jgi:peptide-methionine (R)-S-oxide reductase
MSDQEIKKVQLSDEEWKARLTPEQYKALRREGTDPPFINMYVNEKSDGIYRCAGCGTELFSSETKYDSKSGWPSFYAPLDSDKFIFNEDRSFGMVRIEVKCATCEGHLGHLFDDGPQPTGLRYCMNSSSLDLEKMDADDVKTTS